MLVRYCSTPERNSTSVCRRACSCGSSPATRDSMAHTPIGRIVHREDGRDRDLVRPGRTAQIRERRDRQHRVRRDLQSGAGVDMHCAPVDFDDTPRAADVSIQSPSWKGCSNSMSRPEMIWPTEFCSVRPMTIEVIPKAVNRPSDVRPPDVGEDDRQADGDQQEPRDVDEDRRDTFAPRAFGRGLEQCRIDPGEQQHHHHEAEQRGDDLHRCFLRRNLRRFDEQQKQRPERQQVVAQEADGLGEEALPADESPAATR